MGSFICAVFIIIPIIILAIIPSPSAKYKNVYSETEKTNLETEKTKTQKVITMDEYVKQQENIKIEAQKQKDKEYLNSKIQVEIDKQDSEAVKAIFQTVLDLPDDTDERFEYKKWLFNYGDLRTDKEIEDWNYQHGGFEEDLEKPKWYIWIWIISCFVIGFSLEQDEFGFIIAFVIAVFTAFIPFTIYCCSTTSKLKKARKHGVSPRDPKFVDASVKAGIAAAGAASTLHASSKGIKNLTK